jgi:RNA polymerase sigma-70 factor (ECF subfamily)
MPETDVQALYRRYGAIVYSRCHRILGNRAAAEDAAQETFLRVHRHLASVPPADEAVRWIYRIATNHCLNELRRERMRGRPLDSFPELSDQPFGEDRIADRDLLRRLVTLAPPRLGEAAWLYHVDDLDQNEVARVLGVSRRSVVTYLNQFKEFAQRYLRQSRPKLRAHRVTGIATVMT